MSIMFEVYVVAHIRLWPAHGSRKITKSSLITEVTHKLITEISACTIFPRTLLAGNSVKSAAQQLVKIYVTLPFTTFCLKVRTSSNTTLKMEVVCSTEALVTTVSVP
jgi:hypothetical protein